MTDDRWLALMDPQEMLRLAGGRASERKIRLFAVACCRRAWHLLDDHGRAAVLVAEAFADQRATLQRALEAQSTVVDHLHKRLPFPPEIRPSPLFDEQLIAAEAASTVASKPLIAARTAARALATEQVHEAGVGDSTPAELDDRLAAAIEQEGHNQCAILREMIPNPLEAAPFFGRWVSCEAFALAERIDTDGAFELAPELADALARMGCMDRDVLEHCRATGPHLKGCWAVDLLLGKP